jgi:hypothetical protein
MPEQFINARAIQFDKFNTMNCSGFSPEILREHEDVFVGFSPKLRCWAKAHKTQGQYF